MEKELDKQSDSDSSDGLPDLFPKRTFDILKLKKNDIVWAQYRGLHWPALVISVDKKCRKVKLWYLDSPKVIFRVPFKKIHDFADIEFNKQTYSKAKLHPFGQRHSNIVKRTHIFIERRCRGINDIPSEFFDTSKPYFLYKDLNTRCSKVEAERENTSTENVDKNGDLEESSEGESLNDSDEESSTYSKYLPKIHKSPYNKKTVDKILTYIKKGHVDKYLVGIANSKISSEKHELFLKSMQTNEIEQLWNSASATPIDNSVKLQEVLVYLYNLYQQKIGKRNKLNYYIVLVWLPEAINKSVKALKLPFHPDKNK